jgi:hypothetical protein
MASMTEGCTGAALVGHAIVELLLEDVRTKMLESAQMIPRRSEMIPRYGVVVGDPGDHATPFPDDLATNS